MKRRKEESWIIQLGRLDSIPCAWAYVKQWINHGNARA